MFLDRFDHLVQPGDFVIDRDARCAQSLSGRPDRHDDRFHHIPLVIRKVHLKGVLSSGFGVRDKIKTFLKGLGRQELRLHHLAPRPLTGIGQQKGNRQLDRFRAGIGEYNCAGNQDHSEYEYPS